jgi:hypothetical protein
MRPTGQLISAWRAWAQRVNRRKSGCQAQAGQCTGSSSSCTVAFCCRGHPDKGHFYTTCGCQGCTNSHSCHSSQQTPRYRKLVRSMGYIHKTVIHSINYVYPVTGCHTNDFESQRNVCKAKCEARCGEATNRKGRIGFLKDLFVKESYRTCKCMDLHNLHSCIRCESGEEA